ncbi:MAG: inorganic diphosphatase [Cyclobacteriaceae bacterium]
MIRIVVILIFALPWLFSCIERDKAESDKSAIGNYNFLNDLPTFTADSLVNVVIEIPAGTNQKWELNKANGQIEWEQITADSFRVVNYLSYPANYGFVPQTYLPEETGGDGDPIDVFVLGESIARETVVTARIVGIIHMLDDNEADSKLLAVNTNGPGLNVYSFEMLNNKYPGVTEIIKLWLSHYKGHEKVKILSVNDEKDAIRYLKKAHIDYIAKQEN